GAALSAHVHPHILFAAAPYIMPCRVAARLADRMIAVLTCRGSTAISRHRDDRGIRLMIVPGTSDPAAHRYAATATLRDGGSIVIRALRPDDKTRLRTHFEGLSAQSRYFRFLASKKSLSDEELREFTELDFRSRAALVATLQQGEDERIIGVARYAVAPDAPDRAEVGFAVLDEHQGRGIGTVLLEHLATLARANGITEFEADVLGENSRMLGVFADSGFAVTR